MRAALTQQHAEVQSLQSQLEAAKERELAASVAADLAQILDDPDQLPVEAHQLISSLRKDAPDSERGLHARLQQLQKQLHSKEEQMKERDLAMQQLLRGADRIEEVQRATLAQLADAQSEVLSSAHNADCAPNCCSCSNCCLCNHCAQIFWARLAGC